MVTGRPSAVPLPDHHQLGIHSLSANIQVMYTCEISKSAKKIDILIGYYNLIFYRQLYTLLKTYCSLTPLPVFGLFLACPE